MMTMSKKFKLALLAFLPSIIVLLIFIVFVLWLAIFDWVIFFPLIIIIIPYNIAFVLEYTLEMGEERNRLSEYELSLIREKENIIKSLEIIIVSFSLLFGLFTSIEFDLIIAGMPNSQFIRLLGAPFGVDFFMSTFVFLQVQIFGKNAYLNSSEIDDLTVGFEKTSKIKNQLSKLSFANFTRKGCYYSLLIQICLIYPVVMSIVAN